MRRDHEKVLTPRYDAGMSTPSPQPASRPVERAFSAVPDALTALYFLSLWLFPLMFGQHAVRNGMLLMLVEFILLHASIFLGATAFSSDTSRSQKVKRMAGFALLYSLFVGVWAFTFQAWWPLLAFGWLLASKFSGVFGRNVDNAVRLQRLKSSWALATLIYIGGAVLTTVMWVPGLGITPAVREALELPGSGLWVERPQTVIVFGLLYFGTLAVAKWRGWTLPDSGDKRPA